VLDVRTIAARLGGDVASRDQVNAPGPGHSPRDRSMSVRLKADGDFIVNSFAGDDPLVCKDYVREKVGLAKFRACSSTVERAPYKCPIRGSTPGAPTTNDNTKHALELWKASTPLRTLTTQTLGWRYFTERRQLHIGLLEDLSHCLRWHDGVGAVIALMTDARRGEPCGVHRTFLNPDGTKRERKMLGRAGVIRLTPDEDVTQGLGICEGVEDGLAILLSGWAPVWCATSCGAISNFSVLAGIEALTIFADDDEPGQRAARACVETWRKAGHEACVFDVKDFRT
jgi:putative DNA primase/helicase